MLFPERVNPATAQLFHLLEPQIPIPDYQTLMLPVLRAAQDGEIRIGQVIHNLAQDFQLSEEDRTTLLPSGRQTVFTNRVHWAKTYLTKAGLLDPVRRGVFCLTEAGRSVLAVNPSRIDNQFLSQFEEFRTFRDAKTGEGDDEVAPLVEDESEYRTPGG